MDVVQAVVSEIVNRAFSLLIDNFPRPSSAGAREVHRRRLKRVVPHISMIVEEAEGRDISSLQVLAQVKELSDAMYRGRFALEAAELDDVYNDMPTAGRRSLALYSPYNAVKRFRITRRGRGGATTEKRLETAVEDLETLTRDYMREFILLVQGYPRAQRNNVPRPLITTLFIDQCVFGRHVEKESVIAFLLQPAPTAGLSALAVVGGPRIGKTTLVKHVCADDRVRDHFPHIQWFSNIDLLRKFRRPDQTVWRLGGPEYLDALRRFLLEFRAVGQSLLVFEDAVPVDESAWAALLAASALADNGSKLLFTCGDDNVARTIGTVEPVVLRPLQEEEYWYYFKAFVFCGADPRDHPRMAKVAMEISRHLELSFEDARVLGPLLRANFNPRFWYRVLAAIVMSQHYPPLVRVLLDHLPAARAMIPWYSHHVTQPDLTLQDVLSVSASSSGSGTPGLGSGNTMNGDSFTILLRREILYMDYSYSITFGKDDGWPEHDFFTRPPDRSGNLPMRGRAHVTRVRPMRSLEMLACTDANGLVEYFVWSRFSGVHRIRATPVEPLLED